MDTKQLYDVLVEKNIKRDIDNQEAAIEPWTMALLASKEDFEDSFHDYLAEMSPEDFFKMQEKIIKNRKDVDGALTFSTERLKRLYFDIASDAAMTVGYMVIDTIVEQTQKWVTDNLHDWFSDCINYERDMLASQVDDVAYERRRDA